MGKLKELKNIYSSYELIGFFLYVYIFCITSFEYIDILLRVKEQAKKKY